MSKTLDELKARYRALTAAIANEPSNSLYFQDVQLTLATLRAQINNLEFSRSNPLVMVNNAEIL